MIQNNLYKLQQELPSEVNLIAVSKNHTIASILSAYDAGQRHFGENKVQELISKYEPLPKDIKWHLIGHLQSNKVKYIVPFIDLIQSVDSSKLLLEINKQGEKCNRIISVLLQFHISKEETKFGFTEEELIQFLSSPSFNTLSHLRICGVMGMASFTENQKAIRTEFQALHSIFTSLKSNFFSSNKDFKEISMGMSSDYITAIEEGSTMVRIGSSIFGTR